MQQQINHVSHVVFVYKQENFLDAVKKFEAAFGITDWDGPRDFPYFKIRQVLSTSAGIEILTPLTDDGPFEDHLREKGEGFYAMVYGVADLDRAVRETQERGVEVYTDETGSPVIFDAMVMHGDALHPSWPGKFKAFRETPLKPLCGVNLFLGQIEPLVKD